MMPGGHPGNGTTIRSPLIHPRTPVQITMPMLRGTRGLQIRSMPTHLDLQRLGRLLRGGVRRRSGVTFELDKPSGGGKSAGRFFSAAASADGGGSKASGPGAPGSPPAAPPSAPPGGKRMRIRISIQEIKDMMEMIKTPEGELKLFDAAVRKEELGLKWLQAVVEGLKGNNRFEVFAGQPLVGKLFEMTQAVLTPQVDNFTSPERTPWGGYLIPQLKAHLDLDREGLVGESWEVSGHKSFPNAFDLHYAGRDLKVPLPLLGKLMPERVYGSEHTKRFDGKMPFLTKLLNSGSWQEHRRALVLMLNQIEKDAPKDVVSTVCKEFDVRKLAELTSLNNHDLIQALKKLAVHSKELKSFITEMLASNLSVQIHPQGDYSGLKAGEHSKTEAWYIIAAEEGAGIYLGLKEGATESEMRQRLEAGEDISDLLNFVEAKPGDIFYIPAGTPHAIGAGLLLAEVQETSETTYRYYDWGRLDDKGNPRELHVEDALAVTDWDAPRGQAFVESVSRKPHTLVPKGETAALVEALIREKDFALNRITFEKTGDEYEGKTKNGIEGHTVIEGGLDVVVGDKVVAKIQKGQSIVIPAALGEYLLVSPKNDETVVLQSFVPVVNGW